MTRHQFTTWTGMIGTALFVGVFTLEGMLRPGYNALGMFVSELALGPRGWVQTANFLLSGALFLIYTRAIADEFKTGKASRAGPILLTIIGFSLFVSGFFTMDPVTTLREDFTWHGILHNVFGALVFSLSPISCFVFFRRFREDPRWQPFQWWTLAVGIITAAAIIPLKIGQPQPPMPPNDLTPWIGVFQRMLLIPFFAWNFAIALRLYRLGPASADGS